MRTSTTALVTLLTDFGTTDWFVGSMKGVLARLAPKTQTIDITHDIPAGNIRSGAFALAASYRFFPKGTIHVAVVDPGVGSDRKAIVVRTTKYYFVGPDNGLISWALKSEVIKAIHSLENKAYFLQCISQTFHGRDIFAPVAAHLARGVPVHKLGPARKNLVRLEWPEPRRMPRGLQAEIVYIDRFGNALTNVDASSFQELGSNRHELFLRGRRLCTVAGFYDAVPRGGPVAVLGSSGFLEVALNRGNAAQELNLHIGDKVTVRHV